MNKENYASLEASKRLMEARIELETDLNHVFGVPSVNGRPPLMTRKEIADLLKVSDEIEYIPAPSMAEVWRELPEGTIARKLAGQTWGWVDTGGEHNANPTDALIDLLIRVKEHHHE